METQRVSVVVPAEIAADVEEIVSAVAVAAEQQGHSAKDTLRILRPQSKGMVPGAAEASFLIVGGSAWFTKKWVDVFVWPEIEKRIKKPSQRAVEFVFSKAFGASHDDDTTASVT